MSGDVEEIRPPHSHDRKHSFHLVLSFIIFGTLNNLPYVVVLSASHALTTLFRQDHNFGFILWANVFGGLVIRIYNVRFLQGRVSHNFRMKIVFGSTIFGLLGIALASRFLEGGFGFWVSVSCILFVGIGNALGESVTLSSIDRMQLESSKIVQGVISGWGMGTGLAGILGSGAFVLFDLFGWDLPLEIVAFVPGAIVYFVLFVSVVGSRLQRTSDSDVGLLDDASDGDRDVVFPGETSEDEDKQKGCWSWVFDCMVSYRIAVNMFLVYAFEYCIITSCAERVFDSNVSLDRGQPAQVRLSFEILGWCYQIGVFLSRSFSLRCCPLSPRGFETLTVCQFLFLILWLFLAKWRLMSTAVRVWGLFGLIFGTGLLGGSSYVNGFHSIVDNNQLTKERKESLVNVTSTACGAGIFLAAVMTVILDWTFYDLSEPSL